MIAGSKKTKSELLTELKKLQEELEIVKKKSGQSSSTKWDSLIKNSHADIFILNQTGIIIATNKDDKDANFKKKIGKKIVDLFSKSSQPEAKKALTTIFKKGVYQEFISQEINDKKEKQYFKNSLTPIVEYKKITGAIVKVENCTADIELQEKLKHSEEKYLNFMDQIPSAVIIYVDFKLVFANKAAFELFGVKKNKSLDKMKQDIFKYVLPPYQNLLKRRIKKVLNNEQVPVSEFEVKALSGEILCLETKPSKIYYQGASAVQVVFNDVTNRKKIEESVREFQNNLTQVLKNINELVYYVEFLPKGETKLKYVGKQIETIFGVSLEEYEREGKKLWSLCHPDDSAQIKQATAEVKRTRKPRELVYRFLHRKKQQYIWVEERIIPQIDEEGNYVGNFGLIKDVTLQINNEQRLKEEKLMAQNYLDVANVVLVVINKDQTVGLINKMGCNLLGYKEKEIIGKNWFDHFVPKEVASKMRSAFLKALKGKLEIDEFEESEIISKKGKRRTISWKSSVIRDEKEKIASILSSGEDITERIIAEKALKDSETKFRMLAENATDVVYRISLYPEVKYEYISPSIHFMTGYTPEEYYKNPQLGFKIIHPDDLHLLGKMPKKKDLLPHMKIPELTLRWVKKDGSIVWTETRNKLIVDDHKQLVAVEGISRDVTLQKQSEIELKDSEKRFRILSNATFEGIVFSENERIIDANDQFMKLFEYTDSKEFIGKNLIDNFVVEEQRDMVRSHLQQLKPEPLEVDAITKNGTRLTVEAKGQNIPYFGRQIRATVIYDITQRKQYQRELEQSGENYKSLIDNSPNGILIYYDGKLKFANRSALKLLEADSFHQVHLKENFSLLLPEYRERARERVKRASEGESLPYTEVKLKTLKGNVLILESKPIAIKYNGEDAIQIVLQDTSPQKQLIKEQLRAQIAEETNFSLQQEIFERKHAERTLQQTQKYTRLLIDSSLDMICASDKEGYITEFNAAAEKTFGYDRTEVLGKHVSMLYANSPERIKNAYEFLYEKGKYAGEVMNIKKNGQKFIAYLSASVLRNDEGELVGAMGVSRDISEMKKAELELRNSEERYRAIYDQVFVGIAKMALNGRFIQVNEQMCNMLGYTKEELCNKTFMDITVKEDVPTSVNVMKKLASGQIEKTTFEKRYLHKNGKIVNANIATSVVMDVLGNPSHVISIFQNITERVKLEHDRQSQSARHNAIIESSSHIIWTTDKQMCLTSFNKNYAADLMKHYNVQAYMGLSVVSVKVVLTEEYNNYWLKKYEAVLRGEHQYFETKMIDRQNNVVWREIFLNPIFDELGNLVEVAGIGLDITEKKLANEQIHNSLQEKEVLLKEVHHRVKNNLQVISSILNLQSSYVKDQSTLNILKESQDRIKSMAFIHESLYQTKDFSSINFSEYVVNLSQNLLHSYSSLEHEIKLNLDIQNVFLNLDLAIPCGLIINEIVSNALKYAFVDKKEDAEIMIKMHLKGENLHLQIKDNGIGLPKHIDYRNTESLGLQLVVTLVDQLNGSIELDCTQGAHYNILFKQNQVKNRI
jgi:PAS domain S-box-containing protein